MGLCHDELVHTLNMFPIRDTHAERRSKMLVMAKSTRRVGKTMQ
jgi:hypothetical protein